MRSRGLRRRVMGAHTVTVNDVLDGHVALDIQCLDRIYQWKTDLVDSGIL